MRAGETCWVSVERNMAGGDVTSVVPIARVEGNSPGPEKSAVCHQFGAGRGQTPEIAGYAMHDVDFTRLRRALRHG